MEEPCATVLGLFILLSIHSSLRGLDFAPIASFNLRDDTPIVVVQHGLSGGRRNNLVFEMLNLMSQILRARIP